MKGAISGNSNGKTKKVEKLMKQYGKGIKAQLDVWIYLKVTFRFMILNIPVNFKFTETSFHRI